MTQPLRTACAARRLAPAPDLAAFVPSLRREAGVWLLESALRGPRLGRYSFAGADPWLVLTARDRACRLEVRRAVHPALAPGVSLREADPLDLLRELLPPAPEALDSDVAALPFLGGAVGCLGYGLAASMPPLCISPRRAPGAADLVLLFVDRLLALDHRSGALLALGVGLGRDRAEAEARADAAAAALEASLAAAPLSRAGGPAAVRKTAPDVTPSGYAARVLAVKERIEAGDVYQACLTHRLQRATSADPWWIYHELRRRSPAPFAAYLELPGLCVVSSSPERFLRVEASGRVETRPMKGTRPRGENPAADAKLRTELRCSVKDRAENVMIVDLARNDLGRVCATGSVVAGELFAVEEYATVFQLVSTISGRLAPGRDAVDAVRAAFPPGSMTGAPKRAAMQVLGAIEPDPRGLYAGALGYFDLRGGADLSVAIRSLFVQDGVATLHVGGGVVADSDPLGEYQESLDKAEALLSALGAADEAASQGRPEPPEGDA